MDRDYYGFNPPDRDSWLARVHKYIDNSAMPMDVWLIIAEYGSTFILTLTEPCHGCASRGREMHGPFDVAGGLDAIKLQNAVHESGYIFKCVAIYCGYSLKDKSNHLIALLRDGTWHRQHNCIVTNIFKNRSLSNPNGRPFIGPNVPRDAYVIIDGNKIMDSYEDCFNPKVLTIYNELPMIGQLTFRPDIF